MKSKENSDRSREGREPASSEVPAGQERLATESERTEVNEILKVEAEDALKAREITRAGSQSG